jgi:hypothetical protein
LKVKVNSNKSSKKGIDKQVNANAKSTEQYEKILSLPDKAVSETAETPNIAHE